MLLYSFLVFYLWIHTGSSQVVSPSHTYNVTSPQPNAPYVAGQILPISYDLPNDANLPNLLSLSVLLATRDPSLHFQDVVIASNADISQGFSFRHMRNTDVYFTHELNYAIPNNTATGNYDVVFVDDISRTNTTVPITIRPYAAVSTHPPNDGKPHSSSIFTTSNGASKQTAPMAACMALIIPYMYFAL